MQKTTMRLFLLAAAAAFTTAASAHTGDGAHAHAFVDGLVHPFTGLDHLAAMLAVGMWSALAVRPAWLAPAAFVALLVAGALAGFAGLQVPAVEPMIAASLLVLGLLVAAVRKQGLHTLQASAVAMVGAFAFFHGAAHGSELASGQQWLALAGMVLATATLHAIGIALGRLVLTRHVWLPRVSGAAVALLGVALLARLA
ncbi:MAG: HupE/UreJ family protein [Variovorax sp.]|nr:MAG: HupE/UreJ family protein [Variovorax sp.]